MRKRPRSAGRSSERRVAKPVLTLVGFACVVAPSLLPCSPLLVWNASASVPVGLYRLAPGTPVRGDLVLVRLPEPLRDLAAERGYLPPSVPLIKHLAAEVDDSVCADGEAVSINGRRVVQRRAKDRSGRPLPAWAGCQTLPRGSVFLLGDDTPASFDSRYFGPIPEAAIVGRLVPIWTE